MECVVITGLFLVFVAMIGGPSFTEFLRFGAATLLLVVGLPFVIFLGLLAMAQ